MESQQGYLERLAGIDARIAEARLEPTSVLDRAAGLLAGRVGCRVDEAHAYLLQWAAEQGRDSWVVAAEVLEAVESRPPAGRRRLRAAVEQAMAGPSRPAVGGHHRVAAPPAADFPRIAQQVLDGMPGEHAALVPVSDAGGRITDFVFVAVSPSVVDLSGRRGEEIVGERVSETYPTVPNGPVWQAWQAVLDDGLPREIGPIPYSPDDAEAAEELMLTVKVRPVGTGLLNSWVRHDEETRLAERMTQTERLGNLGWGEWDLVSGRVVWSDGMYRIYRRNPADGPLGPEEERAEFTLPEDEPIRRQAAEAFGRGETVDITYRIRLGDEVKHLRSVIDAVRDSQGRPTKIFGIVQDVTARETNRSRLAEIEHQLREHQRSLAAEHELAAQLQQIVLPIPREPVDLPGLRVAVRYLPAEQASHVGGDWFHAATAHDGSVVLAVGDVAGHGMYAATTMAQLRYALATLAATTTSDPATLLGHLNRLVYVGGAAAGTATAVVARYQPPTGALEWAQAGHPAPLLARAGATVELDRPPGPMLGVIRDPRYATARMVVDYGDLLLLYTDGLIERRDLSIADGLGPVIAALNRSSDNEQPLADLLAELRQANPDDDTCIVAVQRLRPPAARPKGEAPGT